MRQLSDVEINIQTKLLRATFLNNMVVLKKYMPELYDFYQSYQPTRAKLTFDHNGEVNMVSEGALVYEEKAKENSYAQAEAFYNSPKLFSYQLAKGGKKHWGHVRSLDAIYERREADIKTAKFNLLKHEHQMDLLSMIGVGLGFHIERLFQLSDIRFFYLFEPDPDCFYCALHCVDFGPMINRCFSQGGAFTIKVGGNSNQFVNGLNKMLATHGYFNVARFFNYRHYRSEMADSTFKNIYDLAYRLSSGWGFFEDEVISISHTLSNSVEKYPYLLNKELFNNRLENKPVFIIGNGPSLDETIDFIKENEKNAIIFSCGTALKPILDSGITPDFHIEMERTAKLYDWVDSIDHKEKIKKINIIAVNTVYTKILKLFKNAYLLAKPKDGGMEFLFEYLGANKHPSVASCNPTVTNAATAAAVYLGFKELYLFGVDYGWIDDEHHHSKGSIYYQENSLTKDVKMKADLTVEGNFVDQINTTQHFDNSRASLEILLENNKDVTCYNCSNGAKVEMTTSLKHSDIQELAHLEAKSNQAEQLLIEAFSFDELANLDLVKLFESKLSDFKRCIKGLIKISQKPILSRLELAQIFSEQYKYLNTYQNKAETKVIHRFLGGTLNYFQSNIMTNAYCYTDKEKQLAYIADAILLFNEHLQFLDNEIHQGYNQPAKR